MKVTLKRTNIEKDTVMLSETHSVCPVCLTKIGARYMARDGRVFFEKTCPEHGDFSVRVWDSPQRFVKWKRRVENEPERAGDCPNECGLCGNHIQDTCCTLLEVTRRCNLNCPVCFASAGGEEADPDISKIAGWYDMLMERGGPFNIQLSGGEPTMRDDLPEIIRLGRKKGFTFFQLNTNGLRIAREEGYIEKLAHAGLSTVFLQFDGFSETANVALRGRDAASEKLLAVKRCTAANIGVVLVPTIMRGVNDGELGNILRFAAENMPIVRGVHFQPVSLFGRYSVGADARITLPELFGLIEEQTGGDLKKYDFLPSNAEHPLCGFHADYRVKSGEWQLIQSGGGDCCCGVSSSRARVAVARKWSVAVKASTSGKAGMYDVSSLDAFLAERRNTTLAVSGMAFQDAYTIDLNRLRRCYIHIVSQDGKRLVPFCSYNLTSDSGRSLHRGT